MLAAVNAARAVAVQVDAAVDVRTYIIIELRAVFNVEGELNEGGADGLGDGLHLHMVVVVKDTDVIVHSAFAET